MSELRANTISDAAGTGPVTLTGQKAAKAHVHMVNNASEFSQTNDYNMSSFTDNTNGDTSASFTNAFENASYMDFSGAGNPLGSSNDRFGNTTQPDDRTSSTTRFYTWDVSAGKSGASSNPYVAFGELA